MTGLGSGAALKLMTSRRLGVADVAAQPAAAGPIDADALRDRANADGEFRLSARFWNARLRVAVGDSGFQMSVRDGQIDAIGADTAAASADVTIAGPLQAWREGFGLRGLTVIGDNVAHVWPYNSAIYRLVTLAREALGKARTESVGEDVPRQFDAAVGRYVYVRIQGVQYRIHYEEAGRGLPIVLQHTAGADGREWRFMLEDRELQKRFRMIAYDLPYHGRSMPPSSVRWWAQDYRLTKELLLDTVVAIAKTLDADGGIYMGVALGGYLALDLALSRPDAFRAVIGVNSGAGGGATSRAAVMADNEAFLHPRVFNTLRIAMLNYGNTAPNAPDWSRREVEWIYNQSAPGAFGGDMNYYRIEHDLTNGQVRGIDTSRVEVHLLSGEYAANNGPTGAAAMASQIKGATYAVIDGGNYHVVTDDYPKFRKAVAPVLNGIFDRTGGHRRKA
jgi:pimeloyl-ACP methyl ester carboxylesterase